MSVIGLDVGTSVVKAVRFDSDWQAVDSASEPTVVHHLDGGGREQDLDDVWSAAARVIEEVAGRCPDGVDLLAVTAQGDGCWLVDSDLRPVGPALLWNDSRAAGVVEGWQRDGTLDRAFAVTGSLGAPGTAHAQLRWLAENDADRLSRAGWLLSCGSWVFARLTGRAVIDDSEAVNPFADVRTAAYDAGLLELYGLSSCERLLPPIVSGEDRVAPLLDEVSSRLGLPAGTPVALAPYDVVTTAVGTGVVDVDSAFAVLGTTMCVGLVDDDPRLGRPPNGMTLPAGEPGRWLLAYATMTGTETLHWAVRMLGLADVAELAALAARSTRPDPPLLLPYLSPAGERAPFLDAHVRGSLLGLELGHEPADVARAVFDGLTLAVLDCMHAAGRPSSVALCGGGARSELWSQSVCDALGVPVVLPDSPEVGARGAVLVGAVAQGIFADLDEAVARCVRPGEALQPESGRHVWFAERYERFTAARGTETHSPGGW